MTTTTTHDDATGMKESNAVVQISVAGLFGKFDYTLPLSGERKCLVIYGPNGVGKTALLRMLHGLFEGNIRVIAEYPCKSLTVTLADRSEVVVTPAGDEQLEIVLTQPDSSGAESRTKIPRATPRDSRPDARRAVRTTWSAADDETQEVDDVAEAMLPEWLQRLRASTSVRLIETDRTTRSRMVAASRRRLDPVDWCAEHLGRRLEQAATEYAAHAQEIDRTFPSRFIEGTYTVVSREDLPGLLGAILEGFERMRRIGLLRGSDTPALSALPPDLEEHQLRFLSLYADDARQKLVGINDFAQRVELFIQQVNEWLDTKSITVMPRRGFVIEDKATGTRIPFAGLSSGERHLLVMWHEFLFCTPRGAIVLIDEPEISWHVSWQKRFLDDLLRVSDVAGFTVVIATHSPFIPGGHLDLTFPLGSAE